jgi:hypothetical protein
MAPYKFLCKLAKGNVILDENANCKIWLAEREGEIRTITYLFSDNDLEEQGFRLIFDAAFTVEAGRLENVPIKITATGPIGKTRALFKIKSL